jgi:hypothetical protein
MRLDYKFVLGMNMTKKALMLATLLWFVWSLTGWAAQSVPDKKLPDLPVEEIIQRFTANESRLAQEYKSFLFKQDVKLQTLASENVVTGEFRRVSEIIVNDRGEREERITYFPPSTLRAISVTQSDYKDLAGVQPFALTKEDLPKYKVTYVGRERIDEVDTYVFDVRPARPPDPKRILERYFEGRIWVDTIDLMIVKVAGRGVPEDENNKFPQFETWRENIAKGLWFPTYTYGDDILQFKTGPVHLRLVIRYTDYRRFTGKIEVIEEGPVQEQPTKPPK